MKTPTLKPIFEAHAKEYPTLYGDDHRAWIRAILSTMLTNGNGYEWENGEFVNTLEHIDEGRDIPPEIQKFADEHHLTETMIRETNDLCPQLSADHMPGEWCGLYHTPENVTDEWLEVVEFVFEYIFQASQSHFYFSRHGMHGKVEPTRIYNLSAECRVKHHFWGTYQTVKERVPKLKTIEEPRNCYNPVNTKAQRDEQAKIVEEIMNEIFQEEVGEDRYPGE